MCAYIYPYLQFSDPLPETHIFWPQWVTLWSVFVAFLGHTHLLLENILNNVEGKNGNKDIRIHLIPHMTQDTAWESDKNTIKDHKREPRGQPFPNR